MRILLTSEFYLSGQSTHVFDLAKQLNILGHEVQIVFTTIYSPTFYKYYGPFLKKQGIRYYITKHRTNLRNIIRYFKPDLIHCHSSTIFSLTQGLANDLRIPFLVTCHGLGLSNQKYRSALDNANKLICVGVNSAKELMPFFSNKIKIIPNGIDLDNFKPGVKESKLKIYYVARLDWSKVSAIKQLQLAISKLPDVDLIVVGNWKPPIKDINFIPWQTDLSRIFATTNIVVACGRTAREAMSSGCAVLLLNKRYDGIIDRKLVNKSNFNFSGNIGRYRFSQIYKDLRLLVNNRHRLRKIQSFSREYALAHLGSLDMAQKTVTVYQQILDEYKPNKDKRSFR